MMLLLAYSARNRLASCHIPYTTNPKGQARRGALRHHAARQVRYHAPPMVRVGRGRHERSLPQAEQIILAHQAQHAFVVDGPTFTTDSIVMRR